MKKWPLFVQITLTLLGLLIIAASAQAAQVTLAWDAVNNVDGYRIFQRLHGGDYNYTSPAWNGSQTTCTLSNLSPGQYYFVARAYKGPDQSSNSNEVTTIIAPPTPTPTPTPVPTVVPTPTPSPTPVPTSTPMPPKGFVLLKDGVPITSLAAGKYSAQDGGKLWIVDISEDVSGAQFVGNTSSKTFHKAGCRYFNCSTCTVFFKTREEAIAAGYKPCGTCKP